MAAATINLSELLKGLPDGAWVAISEQAQEVISYAADLQTVLNAAEQRGESEPLIVRVPEHSSALFL
jgi:hypothetical protein